MAAGVCVSKPTVSKPSQRMRQQQEAPNWGNRRIVLAEPEEGLSNMAELMETPPILHVCSSQG